MKKIISCIVLVAMITSLFTTVSFASSVRMNMDEKVGLLQTLEILGDEAPALDQGVTRGEFVTLLAKLLRVDTSKHSADRYYSDISEDSELWDVTAALVNYVLTVPADRRFRPDDVILQDEAACALMKAYGAGNLKYELYTEIANRVDMLDGVSYGKLTYKDVINLLYNALTGYPLTYTGDGIGPGGKTFMEIYYDMYYTRGFVNAVNESVLDGKGACEVESIRVGDLTIDCELEDAYLYLGREVGVFYTSKDDPQLFYIHIYNDERDVVEITEKEAPDFDETTFTLEYFDKNDRVKQIKLPQTVNVIYNGQNMTNNVKGAFDSFELGKITVLSAKNDNDTVIIESYYDVAVMSVSAAEKIIYGKDGNVISVDPEDRPVYIKDANDNDVSLDMIAKDSILSVYESDTYLKLVTSSTVVTGTIAGVKTGDIVKLTVGDQAYELAPNKTFTYSIGEHVTLYLNYAGYVSAISVEKRDGLKYGWITGYSISEDWGEEGLYVKIFGEDGKFATYVLAEKTRIDGQLRGTPDLQVYGLEQGASSVVDQMILYRADSAGVIREIDTVAPNTSGKGLVKEFSAAEGTYGSTSVGKLIWASTATKVFVLPTAANRNKEDAYAIGTRSLLEAWGTNTVDSYRSANHNKPAAAEVLVLHRDMFTSAKEQRGAFVVDGVRSEWNVENGETDDILVLMSGSSTKEYTLSESFAQHGDLVKGNIITIALNGKNEIASVTVHYGKDKNGTPVNTLKEIGGWSDANHYVAIGKVIAVGDEYADLSITGDGVPTVRFPINTTNIGVYENTDRGGSRIGTTGDLAEAMMRGDIVALTMYRGTMVSISIVKN